MNLAAGRRVCAAPGRGIDRHDLTRIATRHDRTAMTAALFTPTVEYDGLALRETPYRLRDDGLAEIPDDGIVDEVAVDRTIHGRRPARLTPREVICIVHRAARNGRSDAYISALLRAGTPEAITAIRIRHDIPSTVTP